jgi:hypothetical protein
VWGRGVSLEWREGGSGVRSGEGGEERRGGSALPEI